MESSKTSSGIMLSLLTGLTALGSVSVSIYLPSLPSLATSLHASSGSVKLSLTVFLIVFAVSQLIYGPLSDRFGRKLPIMFGLIIYVIGSILCGLASNAPLLIAARMVQALGAAAGPVLGRAVLRDLYSGDKLTSSLAIVAAAVALSPMLGPVIGGYLQVWFGWQSCFVLLSVAGIALWLFTYHLLPETHSPQSGSGLTLSQIIRNYITLLGDREYSAALICGGMLTAGNFAWTAGAPFVFGNLYHFSPDQYGNVALIIGAGYVIGTFISGRFSKRIAAPKLVYSGMALALASSAMLYVTGTDTKDYIPIVALMTLFTAGMGIVIPMSAACALSRHPEIAGSAAGLLGAMQIFTGAMGTLTISLVASPTIQPIAEILTVTSIVSLIMAYIALLPFRNRRVSSKKHLA